MFLKGKSQEADSSDLLSNWVHLSDSAALFSTAECLVFQSRALTLPVRRTPFPRETILQPAGFSLLSHPFDSATQSSLLPRWDRAGLSLPWVTSSLSPAKGMASTAGKCRSCSLAAFLLPASPPHPELSGPAARGTDARDHRLVGKGKSPPRRQQGAGLLPHHHPQCWCFQLCPMLLALRCGFMQRSEICSPQLHLGLIFQLANSVANFINTPFISKLTVHILNKTGLSKSPLNSAKNLSALLSKLQVLLTALVWCQNSASLRYENNQMLP